jgi:AbrB family looped-hinge helix DNA binding protein
VDIVKASAKFQVVIPKKVQEHLQLKPGTALQVYIMDAAIRLSPLRSLKRLRRMAKGMTWKDEDRDRSERL